MTRVIVCGGRDYDDVEVITQVLQVLMPGDAVLVHGACPTGADLIASTIWEATGGAVEPHPAAWEVFGKAAGPLRNQVMADLGADFVIAFSGGKGTADMVEKAEAAKIPVIKVQPA